MNTQNKFDGATNIRSHIIREAGKPLKERRSKRRWLWATVLAVVLSALVCAYAYAKTAETPLSGQEAYEPLPSMEPDTVPANSSFDRTERDFTDTSNVRLLYKKEAFTQEDLNDNFKNYATGESRISLPKTYLDGAVETANVVGIVLDLQEKTPIEGATVAANGDVLVSTDCNGRFQIVNMPDGKYTWTVTASDYFDAQYKNYFVDHFEGANIYTFYIDDEKSIMKDRDLVHTGVQTVPPENIEATHETSEGEVG